jgi:hypothetical protein
MTATKTRLLKEARALFWPWCAVMLVGVSGPLIAEHTFGTQTRYLAIFGFFLGVPLLAALSFGNEFQYRTVPVLLAQPSERLQIWREKLDVLLAAIVPVLLVYFAAWHALIERSLSFWVFTAAFFIAAMGSATLWTLIARSTVGGVILNAAVQGGLVGIGMMIVTGTVIRFEDELPAKALPMLFAELVAVICYAALMLWLGRRKLARFELTGDDPGHDLILDRTRVLPESIARRFRVQRSDVALNLIKKEVRLLRPVWLLTVGVVAFLIVMMPFRIFFVRGSSQEFFVAVGSVGVAMYMLLAAILTGSVSMGEERQSGTHSWGLTLPLSVRRQWFIKFASSMSASLVCASLVIAAAYFTLGPEFLSAVEAFGGGPDPFMFAAALLTTTLVAFWCSCAVDGTIRAAAWTLPLLLLIGSAAGAGAYVIALASSDGLIRQIVLYAHPVPPLRRLVAFGFATFDVPSWFVPAFALAVFQSYRFFRKERPESRSVLQHLIPLCVLVFLCSLLPVGLITTIEEIYRQQSTVLNEMKVAIPRVPFDVSKLDAAHPLRVTVEDLSKVHPLSIIARSWLKSASITIYPIQPNPVFRTWKNGILQEPQEKYATRLLFSNGVECRLYGFMTGCKAPDERYNLPRWKALFARLPGDKE